jgi:hypothetical protein
MDLYLPADYLRLREELPDWRDSEPDRGTPSPPALDEPADPAWQTL